MIVVLVHCLRTTTVSVFDYTKMENWKTATLFAAHPSAVSASGLPQLQLVDLMPRQQMDVLQIVLLSSSFPSLCSQIQKLLLFVNSEQEQQSFIYLTTQR